MKWRRPILKLLLHAKDALAGEPAATLGHFRELLDYEFTDRKTLERLKERRLESLLRHACLHTSYYREILRESGVADGSTIRLENFSRIPLLGKDTIRENRDRLLSDDRDRRRPFLNASGGSTGEPIELVQDHRYKSMNWATVLYYNHVLGKELGDPEAKLWGSERDILKGSIGIQAKIENFLYHRLLLNGFRMGPETLRSYVEQINRFRPISLWTYVDSVHELARFVQKESFAIHPVPITITTAATLPEEVRQYVEKVLGTRVFNQYGSREVGPIACECPAQSGLHLFELTQHVEILDADGNPTPRGEEGEVVVTLLSNYSMPLVRYRIGDMAVASEKSCPCGRASGLLDTVTGRVTDYFVRRDGTLVHGEFFTHLFYHRGWVRRFQVIQEDDDRITVSLETDSAPSNQEEEDIRRQIRKGMDESCEINFNYTDRIEPSSSGKYLYTLSKVRRRGTTE